MERAGGERRSACACLHILLFGCTANLSLFLTASLRQQRGHHHTSCAGPPEGADGDISSGSCQILLRDSAASDDTQPCGENINIQKCSQIFPSLFFICLLCSFCIAGDSQCHAGLSYAVQRKAEPIDPLGRTQRADHHGKTRQRDTVPTQKQQLEN